MAAINRSTCFVLLAALLCLVLSCVSTRTGQKPNRHVRGSSRAIDLARQQIDTGHYQNAIDIYMTEYKSRPKDEVLVREYVNGLKDIMAVGEKALNQNNLVLAGRVYYLLHKKYPYFKNFAKKLSFNRTQLHTKLSDCRKSLSAQGFQEYRQGNLTKAITIWENLLIIDPGNAEIKGAVKTAKLQQKTLTERANGR